MKRILLMAASIMTVIPSQSFGNLQTSNSGSSSAGQARNATEFIESIGVNTHLNYRDTVYGDYDNIVRNSLTFLGIRHIRDELADDVYLLNAYRDLHKIGIKLTGITPYQTNSMVKLVSNIRTQLDILEAVEGPNETDIFTQFKYKGLGFPVGTIKFMKDLYPAIKNDPELNHLQVVQTTLAFPGAAVAGGIRADLLGDLSAYADYGNSHNYFSYGEPPSRRIQSDHLPLNTRVTPGKPMISTEGGYQMGDGDGYKGDWDDGLSAPFDEAVHGRYLLRYVLEQYRLGYKRTFVYELLDIDKAQWGLFKNDGTPRLAARGLRNLIRILGEGQWDSRNKSWTMASKQTASLSYTLSTSRPKTVHNLLLQKSNGKFFVVIWNDVNNWNVVKGKAVHASPVSVQLRITTPVKRMRLFTPLTSAIPVSLANSSSIAVLNVPDHPIIVEIDPA